MPEADADSPSGRKKWPANGLPIVFAKTPRYYAVVKPDQLADWEKMTAESLGISVTRGESTYSAGNWLETVSFCGEKPDGDPNPCDSDVLPAVIGA